MVWRQDDPAGNHGNVFANFVDAYAALREAVAQGGPGGGKVDLWYDGTYADPMMIPVAGMPAGGWNVTGVIHRDAPHAGVMSVGFESGAFFSVDPDLTGSTPLSIMIIGYGIGFFSERTDPSDPPPFTNINFRIGGSNVRFLNSVGPSDDPAILPMIVYTVGNEGQIEFSGECSRGGLGYGGFPLAAPVIDVGGADALQIIASSCIIGNNAITTSVPGGVLVIQTTDDSLSSDPFDEFSFPAFVAGGGIFIQFNDSRPRWDLDVFTGGGVVAPVQRPGISLTAAAGLVQLNDPDGFFFPALIGQPIVITGGPNAGTFTITGIIDENTVEYANAGGVSDPAFAGTYMRPYFATYNQFVKVDTTLGTVVIIAPTANPAKGDFFAVKDFGGNADVNPITVLPASARPPVALVPDTIESGVIANSKGCKTWVADSLGNWILQAQV